MKRNFLFFAMLCSLLLPAKGLLAQADYINREISDFMSNVEFHSDVNKLPPDLVGSPYLNNDFAKGSIYLEGKYKFNDVPLRYNIYNDVMEFEDHGHILDLDERHKIDSIQLQGNTFVYQMDNGNRQGGYFELLVRGKVELLGKLKMEFRERQPAKALRDPEPPKFVKLPEEYFVKKGDGHLEKTKNIKDMVEVLGDHTKELTGFVKKERLKNHDVADMARLVRYYNGL